MVQAQGCVLTALCNRPSRPYVRQSCRKEAAQMRCSGQERKRSLDLIPKRDASDWAGKKKVSDQRFRWSGAGLVGLAGLEPAASSLSGFCPRACFRRMAPATCANDLPLETAGDRCEPLGSDGMWTKRGPGRVLRLGPGDRRTGAPPPIERAGNASTAGPSPWVADGQPCSASHTVANAAAKSWSA